MKDKDIRDITLKPKKELIHKRQIPGHHWSMGKSPSKMAEEGKMVDTYGEEKDRRSKIECCYW